MGRGENNEKAAPTDLVPVTLLCGFLGSGKTTLLKHILETKHEEENFKAAVIVNDMAELNIDKSLIDQTSLVQSDEAMIGMQNGCICCTLQSDLVDQIVGLCESKKFNYILIEASGVSEPKEIAPLFEIDDHEHDEDDTDHGHDHSKPQLGEVARLDTCVTLIDSADFYNNLASMKIYDQGDVVGTVTELMMEQVEFANIILLNKTDLVDQKQISDITEKVTVLNPKAKILKSVQSKINVMDILNTSLYTDKDDFWITPSQEEKDTAEPPAKKKKKEEKVACPKACQGCTKIGCTAKYNIKSFVYRARKPFHPGRFNDLFLEPYFADPIARLADDEEEDEEERTEEMKKMIEEAKAKDLQELQAEALIKQKKREEKMGELLRSKGFVWIATTNDIMGGWQQANNVLRLTPENPWMCLLEETWRGEQSETLVLKDMQKPNGEEYEYKDRRQEVVFIGVEMKKEAIQELLDECLITDEEFAMGPEKWKETMEEFDSIKLSLEEDEEGEEEEDEAGEDEAEEGEES